MKVALDTNVLAYAEGVNDRAKRDEVLALIAALPPESIIVPVQALGELFNVLVRKAGKSRKSARDRLLGWTDAFPVAETTHEVMLAGADLAAQHNLFIWDAVILCASAAARCRLVLSEDLQDGFTWSGVTVLNPFSAPRHELLRALLREQ